MMAVLHRNLTEKVHCNKAVIADGRGTAACIAISMILLHAFSTLQGSAMATLPPPFCCCPRPSRLSCPSS